MNELKTQFEVWEDEGKELVTVALLEAKLECGQILDNLLSAMAIEAEVSFENGKGPEFRVRLDSVDHPTVVEYSEWLNAIDIVCNDRRGGWVSKLWSAVNRLEVMKNG